MKRLILSVFLAGFFVLSGRIVCGDEGFHLSVRLTDEKMTDTSISDLLCSNFIEVGFGYQVEGMWGEMLYNRSFEKFVPLFPSAYHWYGLDFGQGDWRESVSYHTGYDHDLWYVCPGRDTEFYIGPDSTFIVEMAPSLRARLMQIEGGRHGSHCVRFENFEPEKWAGLAQSHKFFRKGVRYHVRGQAHAVNDKPVEMEIRIYDDDSGNWNKPLLVVPVRDVTDGVFSTSFTIDDYTGMGTFSVWFPPGTEVKLDAFSLMPGDTVLGWRKEVVEAVRRVNPRVMRFPGGCFASFHVWKDAIGPFDVRRPEPSYFWGDVNYNDVGTKEFLELCEQVDAEALLCVNMFHPGKRFYSSSRGQGNAHGFDLPRITDPEEGIKMAVDWVAYCNAPISHPMGKLRADHGHPEPFNVKYWEMDNEGARWFTPEEYAREVIKYSQAMKAVDPTIKIGVMTYHSYSGPVQKILDICGEDIDFLADRWLDKNNVNRKLKILQEWNATHDHKLFYADTEALQDRTRSLDPYTARLYKNNNVQRPTRRRCWSYALTLASNLMKFQRYGSDARFLCFNNLANTMGQSCIETPKDKAILTPPGYVFELFSRSEAAWPLKIEDFEPDMLKPVQIQAAYNKKMDKMILYLLNRGAENGVISVDLSAIRRDFELISEKKLQAESGLTIETVKKQGNIHRSDMTRKFDMGRKIDFKLPGFTFIEVVLE